MLVFVMDRYEIIVGIPSYNEADSIGFVVKQVDKGLRKYYPDRKSLIVCCDGNSKDGTRSAFLDTETLSEKRFLSTKARGKGNGLKMLFRLAIKSKSLANLTVDADLKSIEPEWVRLLAGPVLQGYDYVTPVYVRERYDGTITNHITYPLIYGLLGRDIRQPIAGDFAFSTKLADYWMKQKWSRETGMYGIDIFMTTQAVLGKFRICQAGLGRKVHKLSDPKLNEMFLQVVRSVFDSILDNRGKWANNSNLEREKVFGVKTLPEPRNMKPDPERILQTALSEYRKEKLKKHLSRETFEVINRMFFERNMDMNKKVWTHAVYDLMRSYLKRRDKGDVIKSMRPLYFARLYTFFKKIPEYTTEEVESEIKGQAEYFREMRNYLIERINK